MGGYREVWVFTSVGGVVWVKQSFLELKKTLVV